MKRTFIRRLTSTIVALAMISIPMPTGTFAVEPDINTIHTEETAPAETSVTEMNSDDEPETTETNDLPAETTAPEETTAPSVTEPPAETTAPAETSVTDETEETEQYAIDLLELEPHTHNGKTFEPWTGGYLNDGSYYIAADNVEIKDIDGKVDLCLNGKSIKSSLLFYIEENTVLNIYDDYAPSENVQIYIDGIYMGLGGKNQTINIYGGHVNLSSDVDKPATINVYDGKFDSNYSIGAGTLNIYGGEIAFRNLDISNDSGKITLSGSPKMDGTTITTNTENPIQITGPLGADVKCKVQLGKYGEYGNYNETGLFAVLNDESYASADNFEAAVEGYQVVKVGDKLYLAQHKHDGVEDAFKPCGSDGTANSLPATSGSYYLDSDVNGDWIVPNGEINLCLNGHTINGQITVNSSTTLNIYDEAEGKGTINGSYQYAILDKGTVNIYGGNINNAKFGAIRNEYSYLNVKGGTIGDIHNAGQITISGGNVENLRLQNSTAYMKCNITGGNIECISLAAISYEHATTKSDEYLYISGNAAIGEISLGKECMINIDGELKNTPRIRSLWISRAYLRKVQTVKQQKQILFPEWTIMKLQSTRTANSCCKQNLISMKMEKSSRLLSAANICITIHIMLQQMA